MTSVNAKNAVHRELEKLNLPDAFVILDNHTKETPNYFIFYWALQQALDDEIPICGASPFLVDRINQKVFSTGTGLPISDFISAFEKFGDPSAAYGEQIYTVTIDGWREGAQKISATKRIRSLGTLSLGPSKQVIDSVLDGQSFQFLDLSQEDASSLASDLDSFGFNVTLGTSSANKMQ